MFDYFFSLFSQDMGIDLGTANTLVYVKNKGIVINEPSVVAINNKTKQILAIGAHAKDMVGKTPGNIMVIRPLRDGVVSDYKVTEQMLRYFINKVHSKYSSTWLVPRPAVVIGVPSGVTEVERRAVENAARNAGARRAYLIEEPMAAAIGARLPVTDAGGSMIVDIGGGTTEIAIISLGGIVLSRSMRLAGDRMDDDIVQFARNELNLIIGERMAERVKIEIGSAHPDIEKMETLIRGRDIISGLPKAVKISSPQIRKAIQASIDAIVDAIKMTLEETPPELIADILERGIMLAGGGALIRGLDRLISDECRMPVYVAEDPLSCVVRGTGIVIEDLKSLEEVLITSRYSKKLR
ncbi:MAG: rod shape-determining protein [bacterium]